MTLDKAEKAYVIAIRFYINDTPELNVLLGEEESSDEKIKLALNMALSDILMACPWRASYTAANFPYFYLLMIGAIAQLLRSAGLLQTRNQLKYQAGGLSVQIWDKGRDYSAWSNSFMQEYELKKRLFVEQTNYSRALGYAPAGLHSEYVLASFDLPILY